MWAKLMRWWLQGKDADYVERTPSKKCSKQTGTHLFFSMVLFATFAMILSYIFLCIVLPSQKFVSYARDTRILCTVYSYIKCIIC